MKWIKLVWPKYPWERKGISPHNTRGENLSPVSLTCFFLPPSLLFSLLPPKKFPSGANITCDKQFRNCYLLCGHHFLSMVQHFASTQARVWDTCGTSITLGAMRWKGEQVFVSLFWFLSVLLLVVLLVPRTLVLLLVHSTLPNSYLLLVNWLKRRHILVKQGGQSNPRWRWILSSYFVWDFHHLILKELYYVFGCWNTYW